MWGLIPALVASVAMLVQGTMYLSRPAAVGSFLGLRAETSAGTSEIRGLGGMLIAFGVVAIVLRLPTVFGVLGAGYLAEFAVRVVSFFVDRVPIKDALKGWAGTFLFGILLSSAWFLA